MSDVEQDIELSEAGLPSRQPSPGHESDSDIPRDEHTSFEDTVHQVQYDPAGMPTSGTDVQSLHEDHKQAAQQVSWFHDGGDDGETHLDYISQYEDDSDDSYTSQKSYSKGSTQIVSDPDGRRARNGRSHHTNLPPRDSFEQDQRSDVPYIARQHTLASHKEETAHTDTDVSLSRISTSARSRRPRQRTTSKPDPTRDHEPSSPSSSSSSSDESENSPPGPRRGDRQQKPRAKQDDEQDNSASDDELLTEAKHSLRPMFFLSPKLGLDIVDKWDGNGDSLGSWIKSINMLALRSDVLNIQLGSMVPRRLRGRAAKWFWVLPRPVRHHASQDWTTLRSYIRNHFMNRAWLDRQRSRAHRAFYRDDGNEDEAPSDYFARKLELLTAVYHLSDSELILEIMNGAPSIWRTLIDTSRTRNVVQLQDTIKYHEDSLLSGYLDESSKLQDFEQRLTAIERIEFDDNAANSEELYREHPMPDVDTFFVSLSAPTPTPFWSAYTGLIGFSPFLEEPYWRQDDDTTSKFKTPYQVAARPCRYCGGSQHWDYACKHARQGARRVRHIYSNPTAEYLKAMDDYDDAYYDALK